MQDSTTVNISQILDQYKAYLGDLSSIGTRLTTMTTYYVSITTGLIGVLSLKEKQIAQIDQLIVVFVCITGCLVSALWFVGIRFFRSLFRAKFFVITEMEKLLPAQPFTQESRKFLEYNKRGWLKLEQYVPVVFAVLFIIIGITRVFNKI